jgi:chemotaxis family two-component system response regulator Rcp1
MNGKTNARKFHILIIEDNPGDVELIRMALERAELDCEMEVIDDGERAMALVQGRQDRAPAHSPDLVLLDLNLPKHSGLEILEAMRANQAFATAPVAVLSSSSSRRDRARIEAFNIELYITKPADLEEFLKIAPILRDLLLKGAA